MKINKLKFLFALFSFFFLMSCSNDIKKAEDSAPFELTDTMLKLNQTAFSRFETVKNELNFYGKITTDNDKMIEVFPIVGGNVIQVNVELGDYVKKGQSLATIRSTEVADFEKQLEDAQNDLLIEKNNLKVAQELFEGKINSERDVFEAKSHYDKAKTQLNRIQQTYKIYNIRPGSIYEVKAPIDGFIIQKDINPGLMLRSDKTDNIFDIADIKDVWAIVNINESDINKVKLGEKAEVTTLSSDNKIYYGEVDKIFNIIDPETKAMRVRVKLPNLDYALKPEMRATIKLSYNEDFKLIAVPSNAIIFDKSKNYVMIFKSKKNIETRQVEVFRQANGIAYIKRGLKNNERVITHNQLLIYDALND